MCVCVCVVRVVECDWRGVECRLHDSERVSVYVMAIPERCGCAMAFRFCVGSEMMRVGSHVIFFVWSMGAFPEV